LAEAGQVLVSATVRDLVAGSALRFVDKGVHALKGFEEQVRLFAVA
jgi:class 3 adenylate cyclase